MLWCSFLFSFVVFLENMASGDRWAKLMGQCCVHWSLAAYSNSDSLHAAYWCRKHVKPIWQHVWKHLYEWIRLIPPTSILDIKFALYLLYEESFAVGQSFCHLRVAAVNLVRNSFCPNSGLSGSWFDYLPLVPHILFSTATWVSPVLPKLQIIGWPDEIHPNVSNVTKFSGW